jgi:hypothetical protein
MKDFTVDENRQGGWGIVVGWFRDVRISDVEFINPPEGTDQRASLFLGKFSGGSDLFESEYIKLQNVTIDGRDINSPASDGVAATWERIGIISAKHIDLLNCDISYTLGGAPGILVYNSQQVNVVGGNIKRSRATIGGRGHMSMTGTKFEDSRLFVNQINNLYVGGGTTFRSVGDLTGRNSGINIIGGYKTAGDPETPWYITPPFTWNCSNLIFDGVIFENCKENAITSGVTNEAGQDVVDARDITVSNCKFDGSSQYNLLLMAERLKILGNDFWGANQLGLPSQSHIRLSGADIKVFNNSF